MIIINFYRRYQEKYKRYSIKFWSSIDYEFKKNKNVYKYSFLKSKINFDLVKKTDSNSKNLTDQIFV